MIQASTRGGHFLIIGHLSDEDKIETPLRHKDSLDLPSEVFGQLLRCIHPLRRLLYISHPLIRPIEEHQICSHGPSLNDPLRGRKRVYSTSSDRFDLCSERG